MAPSHPPLEPLFPDEIEDDCQILFHGTSMKHDPEIRKIGLRQNDRSPSIAKSVRKVVAIYDTMNWQGEDGGGYAVLAPFSLNYDLRDEAQGSPIFFADNSQRSSLYASCDFAGGEKLRALRKSIADLRGFLGSPDKVEARRQQWLEHPVTGPPPPVDLDWLASQVEALRDIETAAQVPHKQFSGGVIYAVRILDTDRHHFHHSRSMGYHTHWNVPPDRIVAFTEVPREFERGLHRTNTKSLQRTRETLEFLHTPSS